MKLLRYSRRDMVAFLIGTVLLAAVFALKYFGL
jgi:hypothetical protein